MTKQARLFLCFFLLLGTTEVLAEHFAADSWRYMFKPALMLALWLYYYWQTRSATAARSRLFLVAMLFACLGDTLLMFQGQNAIYFLLGLGSFLVMQVLYSIVFVRDVQKELMAKYSWNKFWPSCLGILVFSFVIPKVRGGMAIAVMSYTVAITLMISATW